jgi:hypothetical protein
MKPPNRSGEELAMRELCVAELRRQFPSARIVHELSLRYSSNRIDLAAILEDGIIAVEIKSSRDVADRLEKQLRSFQPICTRIIAALAPKWNEKRPSIATPHKSGGTSYVENLTEAQEAISRVDRWGIGVWTVCHESGKIEVTNAGSETRHLWSMHLLDILHVAELREIAARHRVPVPQPQRHWMLRDACAELMTGGEIRRAACQALRGRDAFAAGSDPPIVGTERQEKRNLHIGALL